MKPIYIFDLDGTLALVDHRRHFVTNGKKNWPAFFAACVDDVPNNAVIATMGKLLASGAEVWIWSGRDDGWQAETIQWFNKHLPSAWLLQAMDLEHENVLRMRPEGDHTPDEILKEQWLHSLQVGDRDRIVAVFDDRDKVVAMWRRNGISCFQVAYGDF